MREGRQSCESPISLWGIETNKTQLQGSLNREYLSLDGRGVDDTSR